jgi:hypothetical protein
MRGEPQCATRWRGTRNAKGSGNKPDRSQGEVWRCSGVLSGQLRHAERVGKGGPMIYDAANDVAITQPLVGIPTRPIATGMPSNPADQGRNHHADAH